MDKREGVTRALEANRAAYDSLRKNLHAGMSEQEAYALVAAAVDAVCGDESHAFIGDFVGGARSGSIEGPATDYVFKPGDAFILDLSVRRGDWWSDTCRTFFFGAPSDAQRAAYEAVVATQDLAFGLVKPGVVAEDVKTQVEAFLVGRGFGGKMPHHVGHLIGEKPYLKPAMEPGDRTVMSEGMICTLEPGLYFEGDFGIRVENDFLIGPDGLENLFDYPRELEKFILG